MTDQVAEEAALKQFMEKFSDIEHLTATVNSVWAINQIGIAFQSGWTAAEHQLSEGEANAVPVPTPEEVAHHVIGVWLDANNIGLLGKPCADLERRIAALVATERGRRA